MTNSSTNYVTLLNIACDVLKSVMQDMLDILDLGKLDSAICSSKHREIFLSHLHKIKVSSHGTRKKSSLDFFPWLDARSIHISKLSLSQRQITSVFDFVHFSVGVSPFNMIKSLELNCSIHSTMSCFGLSLISEHCTSLSSLLGLHHCHFGSLKPGGVSFHFPTLTELSFDHCNLSSPILRELFSGCGGLLSVTIAQCSHVSELDMCVLDARNPNLAVFKLVDTAKVIVCLARGFHGVQSLELAEFAHHPLQLDEVELLMVCKPRLASLSLERMSINKAVLSCFAETCTILRELRLVGCSSASDEVVVQFVTSGRPSLLETVVLAKLSITCASVHAILVNCRELRTMAVTLGRGGGLQVVFYGEQVPAPALCLTRVLCQSY